MTIALPGELRSKLMDERLQEAVPNRSTVRYEMAGFEDEVLRDGQTGMTTVGFCFDIDVWCAMSVSSSM
jgi:hypothetical protein